MTDMKVHILSTGAVEPDFVGLLGEPGLTIRRHRHPRSPAWNDTGTRAVLIEHTDGRVLWDSGVASAGRSLGAAAGCQVPCPVGESGKGPSYLECALAQLELTPDDIDVLVISNLHFDHDLSPFDPAKTRIVAGAAELRVFRAFCGHPEGVPADADLATLPIEGIEPDGVILPGIRVVRTSEDDGESMSLRLDLDARGTTVFTSDAVDLSDGWGRVESGPGAGRGSRACQICQAASGLRPLPDDRPRTTDDFALAVREAVSVPGRPRT